MTRSPVSSSDITSLGWENDTLEIEFKATGVYRYFSVPETVFEEFKKSVAPGKFFRQHVKGKFAWEKIAIPLIKEN